VYEDLLARQVALFVEEELAGHFQPLITFVRSTEAEIHALAMGSRGAAGADGGARTDVGLPEGIVPRVEQVVVVRVVFVSRAPVPGFLERLPPRLRVESGNTGSRFRTHVEACAVAHQYQVRVSFCASVACLLCGALVISLRSSALKYFPRNGMDIFKQIVTQMTMYYTRFVEIVRRCFAGTPMERSLVTNQELFAEIRKYKGAE
jgi:hypothetical protein